MEDSKRFTSASTRVREVDVTKSKHGLEVYSAVAYLHFEYINKGFLSSLGIPFLTLLYEAIDENKESILIVEKVDGKVIGFVSGTNGLGPIYKQLFFRLHRLVWALIPSILSPSKINKILEILLLNKSDKLLMKLPRQELLSIVVNSTHQGKGYAEKLFVALCEHFKESGVSEFRIVVGANLVRAHAFYIKLGSTPVAETEVHKGQTSVVYIKRCE